MLAPPERVMTASRLRERRLLQVGGALLAVSLFILTRPYGGIWHDARLYTFLALFRNDPSLGSDLFVRFGSQDSFTIFSPIYAAAIRTFGLDHAAILLLVAGQALWLSGAWRFIRNRLLHGAPALAALCLSIGATSVYGSFDVFHFAEPFLTPRLFAEALALHALASLGGGRRPMTAVLLFGLAAALHPIMALPGVGVAVLAAIAEQPRRAWWLLPPVALLPLLAFAGIAPFDRLLEIIDPVRRAAVIGRATDLFPSQWQPADWANLLSALAVVGGATVAAGGARRRLLGAACVVAAGGVAATWLFADRLGSLLFLQAQLWRCAWLLQLLVGPALVLLALRFRYRGPGLAPVCAMAMALVAPWSLGALLLVLAGAGAAILDLARRPLPLPRSAWQGLAALSILSLIAASTGHDPFVALGLDPLGYTKTARPDVWHVLIGAASAALAIAAPRRPALGLAVAVLLLLISVQLWDVRTAWGRYLTSAPQNLPQFRPGSQILWGDDPGPAWFLLGTPSYVTLMQGAGLVFSRPMALDYWRRVDHTQGLIEGSRTVFLGGRRPCSDFERPVTPDRLAAICRIGGPDTVILPQRVAGVAMTSFSTPAERPVACLRNGTDSHAAAQRFFVYDCARVRTEVR